MQLTPAALALATHSLLMIAVMLLVATLWRRRRDGFLGIAIGLAIPFWRDFSEPGSGVALLWPFSDHSFSLPRASYVLAMIAVVGVGAYRCRVQRPVRVGGRAARAGAASWAPLGLLGAARRGAADKTRVG